MIFRFKNFQYLGLTFLMVFVTPKAFSQSNQEGVAQKFAPIIVLGSPFLKDFPIAYNFDGDWDLGNNYRNATFKKNKVEPTLYYDYFETESEIVLIYSFYKPSNSHITPFNFFRTLEHSSTGAVLFIKKEQSNFSPVSLLTYSKGKLLANNFKSIMWDKDDWGVHPVLLLDRDFNLFPYSAKRDRKYEHFARREGKNLLPREGLILTPSNFGPQAESISPGQPIPYHLESTRETLLNDQTQKVDSSFSNDLNIRFICSDHLKDYVFSKNGRTGERSLILPKYFKPSHNGSREAKPFWGWEDLGVDPIGFMWRRYPKLAKDLKFSRSSYAFNAYVVTPSSSHQF